MDSLKMQSPNLVDAKLPKGFFIPTPVGNYNPDWAIASEFPVACGDLYV